MKKVFTVYIRLGVETLNDQNRNESYELIGEEEVVASNIQELFLAVIDGLRRVYSKRLWEIWKEDPSSRTTAK